jgi:iron(III) transport system ATP-binding protein
MADLLIEGLSKQFNDTPVLRGVDLSVSSGQSVAILGPSGSGKTTLLRLICGFERPDGGRIVIDGEAVATRQAVIPPERRRIGYVAQEGALFPHLNVADNIVFGLSRADRRAQRRVDALLELVGLPQAYATRWPHELSGGEQQRVALARALAPTPRLVLLDEPFSSLDAALRIETREVVAAALRHANATVLLVTHDQAEALSMGQQVAVLREGRMVQVASPAELYRRPADVELARFVGEAILLSGHASAGKVRCALGVLPLATGMPVGSVTVMLRPEQLLLAPLGQSELPEALVIGVSFLGPSARVRLELRTKSETVELAAIVPGHLAPAAGGRVGLAVTGEVVSFRREPLDARNHNREHLIPDNETLSYSIASGRGTIPEKKVASS